MSVPNDHTLPPLTEAPRLETTSPGWLSMANVGALLETITGTARSQAATLCAFNLAVTGVSVVRSTPDATEPTRTVMESPARRAAPRHSPLAELRTLSGLSMMQLAELFSVTRATIYAWERGTPPRGEREAHLLETLAFARNAAEQFPDARAFKQWLLTPVSPGVDTPLKLMAARRWRPLRGLLVQARTKAAPLRTPEPLRRPARALDRSELRQARRSLSPPPAREDLEGDEMPGGESSTEA